ncbi:MAG: PKD domain-containing protein [Methanomassiliicoccales archaeon]|nr:MAG: PKD domain-containing protein [Methanomassiliicoccales archaeon]
MYKNLRHSSLTKSKKIIPFTLACLIILMYNLSGPSNSQDEIISESESIETDIEFLVLEVPDSVGEGFEPHILVGPGIDGQEWLYIDSPTGLGSGLSGNLWISKDGGYTWEFKETGRPPINYGGSGDSYSAVFSDGTIVFTDLYLITVTVDTSLDGGETWLQNPQASVTPIDDRQWLQIGPTVGGGPFTNPETLYLTYNQIPLGLYIQKSRVTASGYGWIPGNAGLPVSTSTGSRDYFVVDQNDGTLYLPNKEGRNLVMYVSDDGANTFSRYEVMQTMDDIQNIFVSVDVDNVGNVYLTWTNMADVFMGVSKDRGATWEISQVTVTPGTRVLPWICGGDSGRIGLTWYDTKTEGDSDNLEDMENATWDVKGAICVDALSENRTFLITTIQENVHTGTIKTTGASDEPADRDLGDFFTCDVDGLGRMVVTYGKDGDDGLNSRQAAVMFGKQVDGPFLLENVGPVANFTYTKDGLKVIVDASESKDLNKGGIDQYIWEFGDGSNASGVVADHIYNKSGSYNITLRVINKDGQGNRTTLTVEVAEVKEEFNVWLPLFVVVVILIVAGVAYRFYKKRAQTAEPAPTQTEA